MCVHCLVSISNSSVNALHANIYQTSKNVSQYTSNRTHERGVAPSTAAKSQRRAHNHHLSQKNVEYVILHLFIYFIFIFFPFSQHQICHFVPNMSSTQHVCL